MPFLRSGRYWYWLVRELVAKYTRSLAFGFVIGLVATLIFWRVYPIATKLWLTPTDRIGIIGEFTPSTLPLSIQKRISKGLTDIAADGTVLPALATTWDATDSGKVYVFHLRDDLVWHNDKPVTANDINYNIRNVNLEPTDTHTLKVTLKDAYSPFPTLVSKPILQAGLRGFGDYRVVSIKLKGDKVQYLKLVPVTDPKSKNIEYRFYRTENIALLAYKLGEIDELDDISSVANLSNWGKTSVVENTKYTRIVTLFFNLHNGLLKDRTVRQALAFGIPDLPYEKALSPISKTSWAYTDKVKKYSFDPAIAKKTLQADKGASDSGQLVISTFSQYLDTAQTIADSWTALGIPTNVRVETSISPEYEILLTAQDVPPDPDQYPLWHSTELTTNITRYANVKIDKLLEDGRQETDVEKRQKIYIDFQKRLVDDAPAVFLYYPKTYTVRRAN